MTGEPRLRRHQRLALDALDGAWAQGRDRAWVALPPGAGKTLVGLETVRRLGDRVRRTVVLSPNTAIAAQWVAQARRLGLDAGSGRDLSAAVTSLTYQSVAVFEPDAEVDEDGREDGRNHDGSLLGRLHDNGRALIAGLQAAGPVLLVLDECHHLLEVWGKLLAELLDTLPEALVLGLTATPPAALTTDQARLVDDLFAGIVFETSIPAVVREGDLVPFAELVWLTTPTAAEADWLAAGAERFQGLVTQLTDPAFGSVPFLTWLDRRFVERAGDAPSWAVLARTEPALTDAALRLHHVGLLALPPGARPTEAHRRAPSAEDWVVLIDDWVDGVLRRSGTDDAALEAVRRALPAVGYTLTRAGVRRGRTPVDRVLARSAAKTTAAVEIARHERLALGERMRLLVLCDHERASATLPADLTGVLTPQAGSAIALLDALLVENPDAVLVTGSTVAGSRPTLAALVDHIAAGAPELAARLEIREEDGHPVLAGAWTSRTWVWHVTRFFETGGCRILVGTRGLLGEGWDARSVSGIVDLTAVTTTTAVVQTRGRALRTDPERPDKVAVNWSVVCVAPDHPRGDNDWQRLVRKHTGFFGADEDGTIVDGVGHLHPGFSPYAPPAAADFDAVNAAMVVRAERRDEVRRRWRVGEAYDDVASRTVRIRPRATAGAPLVNASATPATPVAEPARVVVGESGLDVRHGPGPMSPLPGVVAAILLVLAVTVAWSSLAVAGALVAAAIVAGSVATARTLTRGRTLLDEASQPPPVARVAAAVADGLHAAGLVSADSSRLAVEIAADGEYRVRLRGVPEAESLVFATALEEAVAPLLAPRYVLRRRVLTPPTGRLADVRRALAAGRGGRVVAGGEVWHAVPGVLGANAGRAHAYARAWDHWIGGDEPLFTGSPEGAGILAAQAGSDPFDVTTVIRRQWS
ncbi:DEAD/DEAH box helicase [Nocardioides sp. DS6]|uniref:DEAD/DEAH box helicase n=1 Tax=Nocardioides eburneus TaxID=3231482 RepID=A0ABV3SVJ5_9ACTN